MRRLGFVVGCASALGVTQLPPSARADELASAREAEARAAALSRAAAPPQREWQPADVEALPPHHVRSLIEMSAGLALGTTGYWLLKDANVVDWDNPGAAGRLNGSAWVFDNNSLRVNFLGHPMWGGLSYSFARGNHHSVLGSFGYAFLTSFIWEFALEFKEKVSLNDVLVTPSTGVPIGEFFYKLGLYLDTGDGSSPAVDVARWLFGTGAAVDRAWDGRPKPHVVSRDELGFSSKIWHDFRLGYSTRVVDTPGVDSYARYQLEGSARLVTLPNYLAPASFGSWFHSAEFADFALFFEASEYGTGLAVSADTVVAGYHAQRLQRRGRGLVGGALTLGSSVGYRYYRSGADHFSSVERAVNLPQPDLKYHHPNAKAQYAALDLPGLAAEGHWLWGWGRAQLSARLQPSFGGLMAPAFYEFTAARPDVVSKHILHAQGYFYGWGPAVTLGAGVNLGPWRSRFDLGYASYGSQDGFDRHADELNDDTHVWGDVLFYKASLGVAPGNGLACVALDWGVRRFRSRVAEYEQTARAVQRGISLELAF